MKELVEVIAKSLVDYPDEVNVTETENEKAIVLELRVAQSDVLLRLFVQLLRPQPLKKTKRLLLR